MTTIDWAGMMANSQKIGEPIPEGDYPAVCEDASFTQSRAGEPQWKITWKIVGGAHNNRRVLDSQTLATAPDEKGAQRRGFFFRDMKSLGMDDSFFAQMPPGELVAQRIVGLQAMLTVTINANGYNNVRGYQVVGQAAQQPQQAMQPQGFQPQQAAQQPMQAQPQAGFPQQQQQFQPAAAAPQPQPMQQPQQYPQQGFQQPQQQQFGQPQQQGFPQAQPQPGFPQDPTNVTQTAGYQQLGGPQPQQQGFPQAQAPAQQPVQGVQGPMPPQGFQQPQEPAQDPNQPQQNGQFTPQPQAPF
jgi:hypothetical protein